MGIELQSAAECNILVNDDARVDSGWKLRRQDNYDGYRNDGFDWSLNGSGELAVDSADDIDSFRVHRNTECLGGSAWVGPHEIHKAAIFDDSIVELQRLSADRLIDAFQAATCPLRKVLVVCLDLRRRFQQCLSPSGSGTISQLAERKLKCEWKLGFRFAHHAPIVNRKELHKSTGSEDIAYRRSRQ
jgi:hypothetical protein